MRGERREGYRQSRKASQVALSEAGHGVVQAHVCKNTHQGCQPEDDREQRWQELPLLFRAREVS